MQTTVVLVLVGSLVLLNGSFAKNRIPGCKGSKRVVCKRVIAQANLLDACAEEKKSVQDEFDAAKEKFEQAKGNSEDLENTVNKLEKETGDLQDTLDELQEETLEIKEQNEEMVKTAKELMKRLHELMEKSESAKAKKKEMEEKVGILEGKLGALNKNKEELREQNERLAGQLAECTKPTEKPKPVYKNCVEIKQAGFTENTHYEIDPDGNGAFKVFCDVKSQGGGWVLIQRRQDGSVDFSRDWNSYKEGFGTETEWWLGLEKIHRLTNGVACDLRLGLIDQDGKSAQALYKGFSVASEATGYALTLGPFDSGTAGDSMSVQNGRKFSTKDRDNDPSVDSNCAVSLNGGWWYYGVQQCADANLNGLYGKNVFYRSWKGGAYSLQKTAMRLRPQ